MTQAETFDVIVIGGGLAGSTAAFYLASHHYSVALIESEKKAHHKVCGEFLSAENIPYLEELGLNLEQLNASLLDSFSFYSKYFKCTGQFDRPARGISRLLLDEACLQKAQQAGCLIFRGEKVLNYKKDSSNIFHLETSQRVFKAKTIFLATGKHDFKNLNTREGLENTAIAFKMHYHLSPEAQKLLNQEIALFFFKEGYGGLSKIENEIVNFCFIISKKEFRKSGNTYKMALASLQKQNPFLRERLNNSTALWTKPLAISGLPYGYLFQPKTLQENGVYFLGDQFAVIPSLSGSGMAIAFYTARKAFLNYQQKGNSGTKDYIQECLQTIQSRMRLAYPFHVLTQVPLLADAAVATLKSIPSLAKFFIQKTRMP